MITPADTALTPPPLRYSISTDENVPVTQADWDDSQLRLTSLINWLCISLGSPVEDLHLEEISLRTYPNPMRNDGVFVAEDKPIEPYKGSHNPDGSLRYPRLPQTAYAFPYQLPHALAQRVIATFNLCRGVSQTTLDDLLSRDILLGDLLGEENAR